MSKINSYKDLKVWQRSMDLVEVIYQATKEFPSTEQWCLTSQMRRAAISIPSNISEGFGRQATGEYRHFLCISRGSLLELETQIILSQRLGYLIAGRADPILNEIEQLGKMLTTLIARIH